MASESFKRSANVLGMSIKRFSLIALTIQNSIHILVMHYSRTMPLVNGQRYFPSTAVFLNEIIKLPICLSMALYEIASNPRTPDTSTATALFGELGRAVFTGDSWKLAIPAVLYTLQNNLQYIAIGNLDAATFQITTQLKILSTALFSVLLLRTALNGRKWSSLFLLMLGVAIVHIPGGPASSLLSIKDLRKRTTESIKARSIWDLKAIGNVESGHLFKRSATYEGIEEDMAALYPEVQPSHGLAALTIACMLSGLASVYFEKILKEPRSEHGGSVWIRNVQLSFYSLWPALFIGVVFKDGEHITRTGFFTGYNSVVWAAILLQAAGGILVAFVVKYADNITKNFATSISIILSLLASVFFFDFEITSYYVAGTAVVLLATFMYNTPEIDLPKQPQVKIPTSEDEKSNASYFDIEPIATNAKTPLRNEGLSTSRPNTPSIERIPRKMRSSDMRTYKREQ